MEKVISVIVPVYGVEPYLDQCVSSILAQTYSALEIVLVDDGSPDGCPAMCDAWAEKDGRIRVIHQENAGLSAARNRGLEAAVGKYILFVDSDDFLQPICCETALTALQESDADMAVFGYRRFQDAGGKTVSTRVHANGVASSGETLRMLMAKELDSYAWNKLYRRELFDGVRYPQGHVWEDVGTTYRLIRKARRVCFCDAVLYDYRQRAGGISVDMSVKTCQDIFLMRLARYQELEKSHPDLAALGLRELAEAAVYLYELGLYAPVDDGIRQKAMAWLAENEAAVRPLFSRLRRLYFSNRKLYGKLIRLRHRIGTIVRKVKNRHGGNV